MTDWTTLQDSNPEPSLLDAIAFAEGKMTIYINNAEGFVAHLRTLPNDEAVALVKHAVREGDVNHNRRELFRSHAFTRWTRDMAKYINTFGQGDAE